MSPTAYAYLLAALAAVCWGVVVIPLKLSRISGRLGIGISLTTGTLVMIALSGREMAQVFSFRPALWALYAVTGGLQFTLGCMLYYEAVRIGSISVAVPITRVKAIPILFFSIALGLATFKWSLLGACVLVVLGGILIGLDANYANRKKEERQTHRLCVLLAMISCACWSVGETLIGTLPKEIGAVATNGLLLAAGWLLYVVYAAASGTWREFRTVPLRDALCYVIHGLVSFSAAYVLFVASVKLVGPPRATCITATYPLISAVVGWLVFREKLWWNVILGALLLVGGVILLQFA